VSEVLETWLAPDHWHIKISGADNTHYILLRNDLTSARCELTMFDRTGAFLMVNGRRSSWRKGRSLQLSVQQARKAAA
jgi:hypothetical protein